MNEKVLVGITIQENSRRLIDEGYRVGKLLHAPLHILHIRQGETVFDNAESSTLLEELFAYGGELGGEVHFICGDNVSETFNQFITDNKITHLVIGEAPTEAGSVPTVYEKLSNTLEGVKIVVLPREMDNVCNL